jgi:hypothetical protein
MPHALARLTPLIAQLEQLAPQVGLKLDVPA